MRLIMLPIKFRSAPSPLDPRFVLLSIIGFWLFYFAIVTLRTWVMDFPIQGELAFRRSFVTITGIAITIALWIAMRPFDRRPLGMRIAIAAIVALPCAIAVGSANYYFFNIYDPAGLMDIDKVMPPSEFKPTATMEIAEVAITRYFFLIAWASLYLAMGFANDVRSAERQAAEFAQAAQIAELRALRYQVNPHFLFNTLNSLSALVMRGRRDEAETMIMNLSTFYRTSLSGDPSEDVSLTEEIALQRLYLDIEAVRFPRRLTVTIDLPAALANTPVPGLIIQPLVENTVKHGVSRTIKPVSVVITVREVRGAVEIAVENSDASAATDGLPGIGLANVRDRLAARFGERAQLEAGPLATGGWRAALTLPKGA
jgi:two-component system, LytTR family, sensor kinase